MGFARLCRPNLITLAALCNVHGKARLIPKQEDKLEFLYILRLPIFWGGSTAT